MPTIDSVVGRAAYAAPHQIAVREFDSKLELTYGQLDSAVSALAAWFQAQPIETGAAIAIHLPNSADFLIAQFACLRAGNVAAYVNYRLTPAEAVRQMKLAGARAIVTTIEKAEYLREDPDLRGVRFVLRDGGGPLGVSLRDIVAKGGQPKQIEGLEDSDAIARFTSGSTGNPKGVLVSHRGWLIRMMCILTEELKIVPNSSTLVLGPLSHHAGLFVIPTILRRGTMVVMDGFSVDKVAAALSDYRISCLQLVPTIMHLVLNEAKPREALRNSGIARLVYAGSPIRQAVLEDALQLLPDTDFVQTYGSHEAGSISCLDGAGHRDPVLRQSAGRPMLAAEVRLRKEDGSELGEIEVKAPWLPTARLTEAGREALNGDWAPTGDLGEMKDGYLFLRDRMNDVMISGGFNVYPLEIEKVLNEHPQVEASAVVSAPDDNWGERVIAFVVPRKNASFNEEALREHCRKSLANYKVPKSISAIPEIPVNPNGKPDRRKLSEPMWAGQTRRIN